MCVVGEVEKVARACEGPKDPAWRGLESFQAERQRAEALEALEEGHAEALVEAVLFFEGGWDGRNQAATLETHCEVLLGTVATCHLFAV